MDHEKTSVRQNYYAILLDLTGKSCFVVGGGQVAERRIAGLLEAKANVTVISPVITDLIEKWLEAGQLTCILNGYQSHYSMEAFLVIAATDSTEINERVCMDAVARGQLVNRADCPEQSNFILPGVVRRGMLNIAVSTSGASPSLTAEIRQRLELDYGDEYEIYLEFLSELRLLVQTRVEDGLKRKRILKGVLELELLDLIRKGSFDKAVWLEKLLMVDSDVTPYRGHLKGP